MWMAVISNVTEIATGMAWTGFVAYFAYKIGGWRMARKLAK